MSSESSMVALNELEKIYSSFDIDLENVFDAVR